MYIADICVKRFVYIIYLCQTESEVISNSFPIYNFSTSIEAKKSNSQKNTRNKIQALCVYGCCFDILLQSPIFWCCLQGDWPTPTSYLSTSNGNPQNKFIPHPKKNDFQNISAPIHYSLCNLFCNPRICLNSWRVGHSLKTCYQKSSCFCWKVEQRHLSRLSLQRFSATLRDWGAMTFKQCGHAFP